MNIKYIRSNNVYVLYFPLILLVIILNLLKHFFDIQYFYKINKLLDGRW